MLPLLELTSDGADRAMVAARSALGGLFNVTEQERRELLTNSATPTFSNRVACATVCLRRARCLDRVARLDQHHGSRP